MDEGVFGCIFLNKVLYARRPNLEGNCLSSILPRLTQERPVPTHYRKMILIPGIFLCHTNHRA